MASLNNLEIFVAHACTLSLDHVEMLPVNLRRLECLAYGANFDAAHDAAPSPSTRRGFPPNLTKMCGRLDPTTVFFASKVPKLKTLHLINAARALFWFPVALTKEDVCFPALRVLDLGDVDPSKTKKKKEPWSLPLARLPSSLHQLQGQWLPSLPPVVDLRHLTQLKHLTLLECFLESDVKCYRLHLPPSLLSLEVEYLDVDSTKDIRDNYSAPSPYSIESCGSALQRMDLYHYLPPLKLLPCLINLTILSHSAPKLPHKIIQLINDPPKMRRRYPRLVTLGVHSNYTQSAFFPSLARVYRSLGIEVVSSGELVTTGEWSFLVCNSHYR